MALLVLGKLIRLQFFRFHEVHAQGLISGLSPEESVPVQTETGVARLPIPHLYIVCHHHSNRRLQAHFTVGSQQGLVGGAKVAAQGPLPHGGRLSKSGDNGIHRQLGAHPVHLVVYPIGNDIAGVFVQLHISEGVRVFQVFIRFGCKCCFEDRILLSHVVLPSQRSRITLALSLSSAEFWLTFSMRA